MPPLTPQDHAQLYRELAISADHYAAQLQGETYSRNWAQQTRDLATRARQAAEEMEGQRRPTDMEIIEFWSFHCAGDGDPGIIKLARFGGGEG